jgi:hypothetical protein
MYRERQGWVCLVRWPKCYPLSSWASSRSMFGSGSFSLRREGVRIPLNYLMGYNRNRKRAQMTIYLMPFKAFKCT